MSDVYDAGVDVNDEQATAEELDDDRFEADKVDYPPDQALASLEAAAPIDTGDVPQDSLEERLWREEPDELPVADEVVELVEPHPDGGYDADFASEATFVLADEVPDDGELLGQAVDPDEAAPAEEAAIHIVSDADSA
jgi:hypothetical protein